MRDPYRYHRLVVLVGTTHTIGSPFALPLLGNIIDGVQAIESLLGGPAHPQDIVGVVSLLVVVRLTPQLALVAFEPVEVFYNKFYDLYGR